MRYLEFVNEARRVHREHPSWRWGQTLFNVLYSCRPELADEIRGSMYDPFYRDSRVKDFLQLLSSRLPGRLRAVLVEVQRFSLDQAIYNGLEATRGIYMLSEPMDDHEFVAYSILHSFGRVPDELFGSGPVPPFNAKASFMTLAYCDEEGVLLSGQERLWSSSDAVMGVPFAGELPFSQMAVILEG